MMGDDLLLHQNAFHRTKDHVGGLRHGRTTIAPFATPALVWWVPLGRSVYRIVNKDPDNLPKAAKAVLREPACRLLCLQWLHV